MLKGRGFQSGLRYHQSENLALMGNMNPLIKHRTVVLVLIADKSQSSRIQVMLDQEDDPKLNDEWLTADEQLTRFSKAREKIRERVPIRTERPSVGGPATNGNHAPIGQSTE